MNNRKEIDRKRLNCQKKFIESYNYNTSSNKLFNYLNQL